MTTSRARIGRPKADAQHTPSGSARAKVGKDARALHVAVPVSLRDQVANKTNHWLLFPWRKGVNNAGLPPPPIEVVCWRKVVRCHVDR